jgi:hypothetical protein
VISASDDAEVESAFAGFARLKAGVLVIGTDAFFNGLIERLATLATRHAGPRSTSTTSSQRRGA